MPMPWAKAKASDSKAKASDSKAKASDPKTKASDSKAKASDSKADSAESQWDRKLLDAFRLAEEEWKEPMQKLTDAVANKDPGQDANKDPLSSLFHCHRSCCFQSRPSQDDQAAKARRLAYHKQLEQTTRTLLTVVDAAQNTKLGSVDSNLFRHITKIRNFIGNTYMMCEKYGEAKEQFRAAVQGYINIKKLPPTTTGSKADRLAFSRRMMAVATIRSARSSDKTQKARLEALKLVMQNINGDSHKYLDDDINVCEGIIFHLVAATYPPPGSGEDSYQACQAHMETLRQATAELKISKDKPTAVVSVFALRVKVRELEILANDMGDLDRVKLLHAELKQSKTHLCQDKSIDEKYRDIAKRLFSESDMIEAKAEIRRKAETDVDGLYGMLADEKQRKHWHENWLKRLEEFSRTTLKKTSGIGKLGVRLTVIDTGVHAKHPQLDRQWKGHFRDFSKLTPLKGSSCEQSNGDEIDPIDEDGHGTFIAGLILRLVPEVDLYVARVGIRRDDMATDENLAYKIGRAIHYAVNIWKTEIISISIGCQGTQIARDSLREAIRKDVIVLAATGNFGDSLSPAFPNNEDRVFKIYSASLRAKPEESSATPTDPKYSFHSLGKDITSAWPGQLVPKLGPDVFYHCKTRERDEKKVTTSHVCSDKCRTYAVMSGTSFSAPIVASMVAMFYQFYNTYRSKMDPCILEEAEGLKTITSIRHILTRMSRRTGGPHSGIHFLSAPTHRSGSDFFFEPDKRYSAKDEAPVAGGTLAPRRPRGEDQNEWKQTYDEFMWRRLVQTINDGSRGG